VDAKEWYLAREKFQRIVQLQPDSQSAAYGLNKVEATIEREKQAFLNRWFGIYRQAFAGKRWEEAKAAAQSVLDEFPSHAEAAELLKKANAAEWRESQDAQLSEARLKFQTRDWDQAVKVAEGILTFTVEYPEDKALQEQAKSLRDEAIAAKQKAEADRVKARELFAKAKAADQGRYDKQLAAWAKEARTLAPDDTEIKALFDKVSAYMRIVRVPGDFATPTEAVADLDDGNVLTIGEGSWQGPLIVDKRIELRGAGLATTIIECPAGQSVAISFGPGAKGAKVTGLTFRHQGTEASTERFSAALVRGGEISLEGCEFTLAAGHGLLVIDGGKVSATGCKFTGNGWDGASASGQGSSLEIQNSEASDNGEHGFDVWNGAAGHFTGNRCTNNGRNGILLDSGNAMAVATGNHLQGNREFGLVLQSAAQGIVTDNAFDSNQFGGLVVRLAGSKVEIAKNRFSGVPSIAVEKGVATEAIRKNHELPPNMPIHEFEFPKETAP
jgi:tetratricopeptide (TPR) repeat protein